MSEQNDQIDQGRFGGSLASTSSLEHLTRDLLADDPSERPTAREVQERLDELLCPLDATGNWMMPGAGPLAIKLVRAISQREFKRG